MNRFIEAFRNLFRIPDLRNRVLFTLALLAVYRIGAHIPTPGINTRVLEMLFQQGQGSVLGIFDLFSGGNLRRLTIFALGIMPYITASIILQLMTVVFPYLEKLQKEGELGRRKITQYTRYLTIVLSVIQSTTIATALQSTVYSGQSLVYHPGPLFIFMTILTLTTGSAFIMWLGEQISERGIGNGMSLIIFVGIVVGLPREFRRRDSTDFCQLFAGVSGHGRASVWHQIQVRQRFQQDHRLRRAAVQPGLRSFDHPVRVLLRRHRLQPDGTRGQHAQEWRLHSGHPAGTHHQREI